MDLSAEWKVVGVVTEARELKSEKNASWRGYLCKVATFGLAAELQLTADQFPKVGSGLYAEFRGRFEVANNAVRLVCESIKPLTRGAQS